MNSLYQAGEALDWEWVQNFNKSISILVFDEVLSSFHGIKEKIQNQTESSLVSLLDEQNTVNERKNTCECIDVNIM